MLQREPRRAQPTVKGVDSAAANESLRAGRHVELGRQDRDNRLKLKRTVVCRLQRSGQADHVATLSAAAPDCPLNGARVGSPTPPSGLVEGIHDILSSLCSGNTKMTVMLEVWTKS